MLTFLEINGLRVEASDPELGHWILSVGDSPEDVAKLLRSALFGIE
jgi:hypothetical protein